MTTKPDVSTPSAKSDANCPDTAMVRALMGGTRAMRGAGEMYMPRWPNEEKETHATRLKTATLFPAYSRTVRTLASKPFSKPITYDEKVPPTLKAMMEDDADLQGHNLDVFAAGVLESALAHGMCGVLVDFPRVDEGAVRTVAEEKRMGLRPYLIRVEKWNVLGWRTQKVNGVQVLTQLRLREFVAEDDGEFGEKEVEQVRVLTPGAWATHRKNDKGEWTVHDSGVTTMTEIAFVPVYGHYVDFMQGKPPMLEMAHLNVKHWQSQSDQDNILHVARVPILVTVGVDGENHDGTPRNTMTVGASHAVALPIGASAGYVEHAGAAIGSGRTSLEDLKEEMRQAGAELLVLQPGQVTATQVASENSVGMCALQRIVGSTEDAIDQALQFAAQWIGEPEGGTVALFKDFGAATLAEASAGLLFQMQQAGVITKKTLLSETQRRGILSSDVDVDAEVEAAADEGPDLGTLGGKPGGAE